ncbi:MAG TPA: hypothetical protein VFA82_08930 [Gaiellaceae bacterium]|nr:hypothetical protein [Gaiellaceae bacterium]
MLDRRGPRFLLELVFLAGLSAGLAFARLDGLEIAAGMAVGWLLVAALEWAAWRAEPHFGSGLPPRWILPQVPLPPPRPLEQVVVGYPEATRDEAPTWIATPALRSEVLGDWPVAARPVVVDRPRAPEPEPAPEDLPDPDSWTVVELPPAILAQAPAPAPVPLPAPPPPEPEPELPPAAVAADVRLARFSFDPLGGQAERRRFGRPRPGRGPGLDVPERPVGLRSLPGQAPARP